MSVRIEKPKLMSSDGCLSPEVNLVYGIEALSNLNLWTLLLLSEMCRL